MKIGVHETLSKLYSGITEENQNLPGFLINRHRIICIHGRLSEGCYKDTRHDHPTKTKQTYHKIQFL